MRLSEAILLGDTLKGRDPMSYLCTYSNCGCALAGARLAVGIDKSAIHALPQIDKVFMAKWPWFTSKVEYIISEMYCRSVPIEQIADYVRSVEPDEPEEFQQIIDTLAMEPARNSAKQNCGFVAERSGGVEHDSQTVQR